jgi:hypothetical protein
MATVKPRKISAWGGKSPNSMATNVGKRPTAPTGPKAPTVTQPPQPKAPTLAAVPPIATGPPPPTLQTTADRNQAGYDYGTLVGSTNTQLRSLAQQFGGAPKVLQYGFDPNNPRGDSQSEVDVASMSPGSTMEVLLRNLGLTKGGIDDSNEANNTFFSSRRLSDLGAADKQYSGDAAAAKRAYDDAVNALTTAILTGRGTRNANFSAADLADVQSAAAAKPEAQAAAGPSPQAGYLDASGHFVSQGISSPQTTSLINKWIDQSKKKPKKK